eukprot:m.233790 g.233790  ORF g.233790 m.233790 type:complete len:206 (-) comp15249_c0_seq7:236-853(-)
MCSRMQLLRVFMCVVGGRGVFGVLFLNHHVFGVKQDIFHFQQNRDPSKEQCDSMLLSAPWTTQYQAWSDPTLASRWETVQSVRKLCFSAIQHARDEKRVTDSLSSNLHIQAHPTIIQALVPLLEDTTVAKTMLHATLLCSEVQLTADSSLPAPVTNKDITSSVVISVEPATLHKCPRCWRYQSTTAGAHCTRCLGVVSLHSKPSS